jgi:hypothetical protein
MLRSNPVFVEKKAFGYAKRQFARLSGAKELVLFFVTAQVGQSIETKGK